MQLTYLTSNDNKYQRALKALEGSGVELVREKLDTPEIQSMDVVEISSFSANWAANTLNRTVVVSDVGYYFEALNGFPGPFIKFANTWFSPSDFLALLQDKPNRKAKGIESLSYCKPGQKPVSFVGEFYGTISDTVGSMGEWKTSINAIFIPQGFTKVIGENSMEDMINFWNQDGIWQKLYKHLAPTI